MDGSEQRDSARGDAGPVGWRARMAAALTLAWIFGLWLVMIPVAVLAFGLLNLAHRIRCVLGRDEAVQANERLPWVGERG